MESRLHGVPLSATKMAPIGMAAPSYAKISGIRAPLTVDESDFEYSVSSKSVRNNGSTSSYYSGSEVESEGLESGEDELETASVRPHQDEEIVEEAHFVKKFAFSEPFVAENSSSSSSDGHGFMRPFASSPAEALGQESGSVSGNASSRPFVRIPDEKIYKGIGNIDDSDDSRSFLSDSGDELVGDGSYVVHYGNSRPLVVVTNEEVSESEPSPVADIKIPLVQKLRIPIAQISGDSDDDSQGSGVLDDEGFSGIVRVPSIDVLRRINSAPKVRMLEADEGGIVRVPSIDVLHRSNSAPKVRMLEADEGDDEESQAENVVEMELLEDTVLESSIHSVMSAGMIQEKGPDINEEATVNMSILNKEFDSTAEAGQNGDLRHVDEEIQEIDVIDNQKKCVELVTHAESTDLADGSVFPENISDVASAAELGYLYGKVKLTEPEVGDLESSRNVGAASLDDEDTKSSNSMLENNLVFNHDNESEKLESRSEQDIDLTVESFCSNGSEKISSVHQCVDIKEVPAEGCPEFQELSEALTDNMQVYMSDSLFKDGSLIGAINAAQSVLEGSKLDLETREEAEESDRLPDEGEESASLTGIVNAAQSVLEGSKLDMETGEDAENSDRLPGEGEELTFHSDTKAVEAEMNKVQDSTSCSNGEILLDHSQEIDDRIVTDLHEEVDADGGISDRGLIVDPAALAAFCEAVRGAVSDDSVGKHTSIDDIEIFSLQSNLADVGLFRSARNSDGFVPPPTNGELAQPLSEREKKKIEKIQQIRLKYLRLLHRLGRPPEDSVASKVLYELTLAEQSSSSQAFHLDSAKKAAMELEAQQKDNLDFSLCILVIGKTGIGKSATINSIFGEMKAVIDAFEPATTHVKEIIGIRDGVKLKVFDTPGLRTSLVDQSINRKILSSIRKLMRKSPPDVILYVDRLDTQSCNFNDLPLLKLVTSYLGSSIWRKSIVALTHGTSIPPDGPSGNPLSYEVFTAQQSRIIQQLIRHASGELLVKNPGSMIPVCLVENHPAEKNGHGEILLHNGESWRRQLLFLCYSMKTLSELSSAVTIQNSLDHRKLFGLQTRSPAPSYILSSFLQSNVRPKLLNDQSDESVFSGVELCYSSDSDQEEDIEHDNLPAVKPVSKSQIAKLSRDLRTSSFDKYDYLIKLFQKKQLREEMGRFRNSKKLKNEMGDETCTDQETSTRETVAVPLPEMALPPSFDGDNPSYRYRFLESSSQLLTRPVLNFHGWDHDCGYDGVLIEDKVDVANHFPAVISVQFQLMENAGIIRSQDDVAIGINFDLCRRDEDFPTDRDQTSLGLSVMRYRGELICGCNLQSEFSVGRNSKLNITGALNNKLSGRISIKTSSSDQLQIAALALVPIARAILKKIFRRTTEDYSI